MESGMGNATTLPHTYRLFQRTRQTHTEHMEVHGGGENGMIPEAGVSHFGYKYFPEVTSMAFSAARRAPSSEQERAPPTSDGA